MHYSPGEEQGAQTRSAQAAQPSAGAGPGDLKSRELTSPASGDEDPGVQLSHRDVVVKSVDLSPGQCGSVGWSVVLTPDFGFDSRVRQVPRLQI